MSRLAPSPTGALHLGNARTFLVNWALARSNGWRLVLRIEDLDTPRVKAGAAAGIMNTLGWLGIDWDAPTTGPAANPLVQSEDLGPYREAMRRLAADGRAYPCDLTRTQIEAAAGAPQEGAHDVPFPPALRPANAGRPLDFDTVQAEHRARTGEVANWRFFCPDETVTFDDRIAGPQARSPARSIGDFVLWTKRDQPSYQLAVVVDDRRQGVTHIVRGDDLLDSAARQILLYRALGDASHPAYLHLPLVLGPDGKRLAKRHGDTRVEEYRRRGAPAAAIVGLMARWSIADEAARPRRMMSAADFRRLFRLDTLPRTPVTCTPEDDRWLLACAER